MKSKTILVVDENPSLSEMVSEILTRDGFTSVETALTHSAAISVLKRKKFDLVIAGRNQYGTPNGIEVLRVAGTARKILMSGDPNSESIENAILESGADAFVPKPFPLIANFLKVVSTTLQD